MFKAVSGPNAGKSLIHLDNWELTTFTNWAKQYPKSTVVSFNTEFRGLNYSVYPYGDYPETDRLLFPVDTSDKRLNIKEPIIAVKFGSTVRAYPLAEIQRSTNGVITDTIEGEILILKSSSHDNSVKIVQAPKNAFVAHTFWFAWAANEPNTELYKAP